MTDDAIDEDDAARSDDQHAVLSRPSRRRLLALGVVGVSGCSSLFGDESTDREPTETDPYPAIDEQTTVSNPDPVPTTDSPMTDGQPNDAPTATSSNTRRTQGQIQDETSPRPRYAAPGDVHQELRNAATADGHSLVRLYPDTTYSPTETWQIGEGITLDYNSSQVEMTSDVDVHDIQPGGQVRSPVVNLRPVSNYTSSVFRFDSAAHGFYGENRIWHVRGGYTRGRVGEGTLFEFAQGNENAIYFVHVDHSVRGIGTVVDMHRSDRYGINGIRVFGLWFGFRRGIHMHTAQGTGNSDNISGNHFDVIAQPGNGTEILWDLEVGKHNVLEGRLWDFGKYNDVLWRIHGGDTDDRFGNVLNWHPIGGSRRRLIDDDILANAVDDSLGDARNRIVVPWLQGHPVSEFTG